MKNPAASCGVSSKEKALTGIATSIPRLPFIPAASYTVFWLVPINLLLVLRRINDLDRCNGFLPTLVHKSAVGARHAVPLLCLAQFKSPKPSVKKKRLQALYVLMDLIGYHQMRNESRVVVSTVPVEMKNSKPTSVPGA